MDDTPKQRSQRWFQFQLSTWLVLTAILAWWMAVRPWPRAVILSDAYIASVPNYRLDWSFGPYRISEPPGKPSYVAFVIGIDRQTGLIGRDWALALPWSPTYWPALALLAFLDWKIVWSLRGATQRRQQGATELKEEPKRRWNQLALGNLLLAALWLSVAGVTFQLSWNFSELDPTRGSAVLLILAIAVGALFGSQWKGALLGLCVIWHTHYRLTGEVAHLNPFVLWVTVAMTIFLVRKLTWFIIDHSLARIG